MFLETTLRRNAKLIEAAFTLQQNGQIKPDTYILDLDAILFNAKKMKEEADRCGIELYFMSKQFGRNPYVCKKLLKLGYKGAVAVDYNEAETLADNDIKLGHIGHLVQIPSRMVEKLLMSRPEVITVYSLEKAMEISDAAEKLGINQNIILRVIDKDDTLYPAQYGGFYIDELVEKAGQLMKLNNITLYGVTSFPCFLYDDESKQIKPTNNLKTVLKAKELLESTYSIKLKQINTPSATCTNSIKTISEAGGTHGEPGHGLLGTTPLHVVKDEVEIPAIVYVSEISHNLGENSYCYGGGHYRRSNMKAALVGNTLSSSRIMNVVMPDSDSIDYYMSLEGNAEVGQTVIMAFRTQIFVTRSEVAVVKGIQSGNLEIVGIYSSLGKKL